MPYAEKMEAKRGTTYRACWYVPGRKTALKKSGFATRKEAKQYAEEQEALARRTGPTQADASRMLFSDWAEEWYAGLDLEPNTTMRNYRGNLENHLLRTWGGWKLRDLSNASNDITQWRKQLSDCYKPGTVNIILGLMRTICADAVEAGLMYRNPVRTSQRRGRLAERRKAQKTEVVIVDPLTAFLIAERASVLTGRDDEFLFLTMLTYTGMRLGEAQSVQTGDLNHRLAVHSQLSPTTSGKFFQKGPKSGSRRVIDIPPFLLSLLRRQASTVVRPELPEGAQHCPCGDGAPAEYRHAPNIHLFVGEQGAAHSPYHWEQTGFRDRVFYPAARGLYHVGTPKARPVLQLAPTEDEEPGPFDWAPIRMGTLLAQEAVACWAPLAPGLKIHGLRHSHRTRLEMLGVPKPLMDDRMGHRDTSVSARYAHPTEEMRAAMVEALTRDWEKTLEQRRAMDVESPVAVVQELLDPASPLHSRSTPDGAPRLRVTDQGRVA